MKKKIYILTIMLLAMLNISYATSFSVNAGDNIDIIAHNSDTAYLCGSGVLALTLGSINDGQTYDWGNPSGNTWSVDISGSGYYAGSKYKSGVWTHVYIYVVYTPFSIAPPMPTGNNSLCSNPVNTTYSNAGTGNHYWRYINSSVSYEWKLYPNNAGNVINVTTIGDVYIPDSLFTSSCTVDWNNSFSGVAYIKVREVNRCGAGPWSDSLMITINPTPTAGTISIDHANICLGNSVTVSLTGSAGNVQWQRKLGTGSWNNLVGSTTTITDAPTSNGNYSYHAILSNSCGTQTTTTVSTSVNSGYYLTSNQNICQGQAFFVGGSWQTTSGTYHDTLTSVGGCDSVITTNLTVNQPPTFNLGHDSAYCHTVTLSAPYNPGYNYLWSNQQNTGSIIVNNSGTYSLTVTDANNCSHSDTINLIIYSPAVVDSITGNNTVCAGEATTLTAHGVGGFVWLCDGTIGNVFAGVPTQSGSCSVVASNYCGSDTGTVIITVNHVPVVNMPSLIQILQGQTVTLDAGSCSGCFYSWSTGSTDQTITVGTTGNYIVTVTNGCGNTVDTTHVDVNVGISLNDFNMSTSVYPNPFSDKLIIDCNDAKKIELTDLVGKVFYSSQINHSIVTIKTSTLSPGVYFLNLYRDAATKPVVVKVLKQ